MTPPLHRREFLSQTAMAAALTLGSVPSSAQAAAASRRLPATPTDRVILGKTGIETSLIGMGTGSIGVNQASNQTRLGIKEFTRLVRYALDQGVTFFDVADQYGSHAFLREALKGVPRDRYQLQTKTHANNFRDAKAHIERYRLELGVDYIDNLLLHCMTKKEWIAENQGARDYLSEAKEQKLIRAHGTSCHGIDPLRVAARDPWVEVDLARINPEGKIMDAAPDVVASELEEMHNAGKGVIGMKILGEGQITSPEGKDASLRHVLGLGTVNAFIIGFESPEQVDDILKRTANAIASLKAS